MLGNHWATCYCVYVLPDVLDATIYIRDNATEVLEGVGTDSVEICIILGDLPSGGLDCNISAELASINITASKCD